MTSLNAWLVRGRVLIAQFVGDVSASEARTVNADMQRMIGADGIAPVHVIVDMTHVSHVPTNVRDVMSGMRVDYPEKSGWTVIVSRSPVARFVAAVVAQILRQKVRSVPDLDSAYQFLWTADPTLPPEARPAPTAEAGV
jgi:anti-anti-sigma regulatory factor